MTTNTTAATNGEMPASNKKKSERATKPVKRKAASRTPAKRAARGKASAGNYSEAASKLMSRGMKAAGGAYEWAAEGAGRALPLAAAHMPDQRTVRRLADERPYVLGAIGLGIGAMIGLILPAILAGSAPAPAPRQAKRSNRNH